jgi:PAS domain S-box-containing protein
MYRSWLDGAVGMRVGELARRTGVGVSTLRAWERRFGFLAPGRTASGQREYVEDDVERVNAVVRLVNDGLTVASAIRRVADAGGWVAAEAEGGIHRFAQILDAADQPIWVLHQRRTWYVNQAMATLFGRTVDEFQRLGVLDVLDPTEVPRVRDLLARRRVPERLHARLRLRRADGSCFLAEVRTTPLFAAGGHYDGAVVVIQDISAREVADRAARLRESVLESMDVAVTASGADGKVVYLNGAAERLIGWPAAEALGRDEMEVFPSADEPSVGHHIRALLDTGQPYHGELRFRRRDGTEFLSHLSAVMVIDEAAGPVGTVAVIADQSDQEAMGRALRRRTHQLEMVALLGREALRPHDELEAEAMCAEAVDSTRRLLGANHVYLIHMLPGSGKLRLRTASPPSPEVGVPVGSRSFSGYVALARRGVLAADVSRDGRFEVHPNIAARHRAAVGAPILGGRGVLGVLVGLSDRPAAFDEADLHYLEGVANAIAVAWGTCRAG